jgi:hypothetical protein
MECTLSSLSAYSKEPQLAGWDGAAVADAIEKEHFRIGREMDCKLGSLSAYSEGPNLPQWQARRPSLPGAVINVEKVIVSASDGGVVEDNPVPGIGRPS